jgi:hypothetical protein
VQGKGRGSKSSSGALRWWRNRPRTAAALWVSGEKFLQPGGELSEGRRGKCRAGYGLLIAAGGALIDAGSNGIDGEGESYWKRSPARGTAGDWRRLAGGVHMSARGKPLQRTVSGSK